MELPIFFVLFCTFQLSVVAGGGVGGLTGSPPASDVFVFAGTPMETLLKSPYLNDRDKRWLQAQNFKALQEFEKDLQAAVVSKKLYVRLRELLFRLNLDSHLRYRSLIYVAKFESFPREICAQVVLTVLNTPGVVSQVGIVNLLRECLELEMGDMGRDIWITPLSEGPPGSNFLDAWKHFKEELEEDTLVQTLEVNIERQRLSLFYKTLGRKLQELGALVDSTPDAELVHMERNGLLQRELETDEGRKRIVAKLSESVVKRDPDDVLRPETPEPPKEPSSGIKTSVNIFVIINCIFGSVLLANGLANRG